MSGVARSEFSLRAGQGDVRAVYVPLARLQRDLNRTGRVNTILAAGTPGIERILKERYTLADLGLTLRVLDQPGCLSLRATASSATLAEVPHHRASWAAHSAGVDVPANSIERVAGAIRSTALDSTAPARRTESRRTGGRTSERSWAIL
jgi:hypothetical protein